MSEKIGLFCGDFDPIHSEAVLMCEDIRNEFGLDRVIIAPFSLTRLKRDSATTSIEHRKNLVKLATWNSPNVQLLSDDLELKSFSAESQRELIEALRKQNNAEVFLIVTSSTFRSMPSWRNFELLVHDLNIVVAMRQNYIKGVLNQATAFTYKYNAKVQISATEHCTVPNSLIRVYIQMGVVPREYLTHTMIDYIDKNLLYKAHSVLFERVRDLQTPEAYERTIQTCLLAVELADLMYVPPDDALLCALLHDIGKCYTFNELKRAGVYVPDRYYFAPEVAQPELRAELAARYFMGITDREILNAVRYHYTGRARMSPLEILLFIAAEAVNYMDVPNFEQRRINIFENPAEFFISTVRNKRMLFISRFGRLKYPADTRSCYRYYKRLYAYYFNKILRR